MLHLDNREQQHEKDMKTQLQKQTQSMLVQKMNKNNRNDMVMNYLTIKEALTFGMTCKLLFVDFVNEEAQYKMVKVCNMNIPKILFTHVTTRPGRTHKTRIFAPVTINIYLMKEYYLALSLVSFKLHCIIFV